MKVVKLLQVSTPGCHPQVVFFVFRTEDYDPNMLILVMYRTYWKDSDIKILKHIKVDNTKTCLLLMNFMCLRNLILQSFQYGLCSTCTGVLGLYCLHLKDFVLMAPRCRKAQQLGTCHEFSVDKENQLDVTFIVFFISLLIVAQHVSGNRVLIIRS